MILKSKNVNLLSTSQVYFGITTLVDAASDDSSKTDEEKKGVFFKADKHSFIFS